MTHVLLDAEVRRLEELRKQDDPGTPRSCFAHARLGLRDVRVDVPRAGELGRRDRHRPG